MVYIGFFMLFAFTSFFDFSKDSLPLKRMIWAVLTVFLLYFVGFRYYTGSDWSAYIGYFSNVSWSSSRFDVGYKLLNILCKSIYDSYYVVQFLATLLFVLSIISFFSTYSEYKFICLFLALSFYFTELFMAQVRQSLAVSVILYGTRYLMQKKWIKWILAVAVASLFHVTAAVALFAVLLHFKQTGRSRLTVCLLGLLVTMFPSAINAALWKVSTFIPGKIGELLISYLNSPTFSHGKDLSSGLYFYAQHFLYILILLFFKPQTKTEDIMLNALCLVMLITDFSVAFFVLERLSYYFGFYTIVGWTYFFKIKWIKANKSLYFIFLMMFIIFFLSPSIKKWTATETISELTGRPSNYQYVPYWNVFNHPDGAFRFDWCE